MLPVCLNRLCSFAPLPPACPNSGEGQFGEVWKGLFQDSNPEVPEYMVACKTVKVPTGSLDQQGAALAEEELLKEALLMAQVEKHKNLVSLVGVITRGTPKVLMLSFCEHGELQGYVVGAVQGSGRRTVAGVREDIPNGCP